MAKTTLGNGLTNEHNTKTGMTIVDSIKGEATIENSNQLSIVLSPTAQNKELAKEAR